MLQGFGFSTSLFVMSTQADLIVYLPGLWRCLESRFLRQNWKWRDINEEMTQDDARRQDWNNWKNSANCTRNGAWMGERGSEQARLRVRHSRRHRMQEDRENTRTHRITTWITRCESRDVQLSTLYSYSLSSNRSCQWEPDLATPKRCVLDVEGTSGRINFNYCKMLHRKASTVFSSTCICEILLYESMHSITFVFFSVGLNHTESENHMTLSNHLSSCCILSCFSHLPNPKKNGANTEPS